MFQNFVQQIACITMPQCGKKLTNPIVLFTTFQKYIFNVHQIATSGEKFNISDEDTDKEYRSEFTKTNHFKWKFHVFSVKGSRSDPFPFFTTLSPTKPSESALASPIILTRFTPLDKWRFSNGFYSVLGTAATTVKRSLHNIIFDMQNLEIATIYIDIIVKWL